MFIVIGNWNESRMNQPLQVLFIVINYTSP